jgi:long-chain-fatty-acid---luciferin-component ligase
MRLFEKFTFKISPEEAKEIKYKLLKESFTYHYESNKLYQEYCKSFGVTPEDIKKYEDLYKIPLIPSDFFKELSKSEKTEAIITGDKSRIRAYFTTSGTTGKPTKYPFDEESIRNTLITNVEIFKDIGEIGKEDKVIFLTPSPRKSQTGMVQGMYMVAKEIVGEDNLYFLLDEGFQPEKVIGEIEKISKKGKIHLYGPPFVYHELCEWMKENGVKVKVNGKAFITGGWKRYAGGEVPRSELMEEISVCFGVDKKDIRDGLGLTDIFSILLECEYHQKHVPPWLHVSVRDPENITESVSSGEEGLIAFMSPMIKSYPAYVITGDIGRETLSEDEYCECERVGNAIEHRRRAKGTAARGCALVLEELLKRMETK